MTDLIRGVVTTVKTSGVANVRVGAQIVPAQVDIDKTVAVGDVVIIGRVGPAYHVLGRYFTTGIGNVDPGSVGDEPPTAPTGATGTSTFVPTRTASYRTADAFSAGWRTDNDSIYQGEFGSNGNHTGCAFYGSQVKTLAGSTVTSAFIKARRLSGGTYAAQSTTLGHITESSKPSGAPTFGGSFTGPNLAVGETESTIAIDTSLAQSLVDGTYGGLGIHVSGGSPYVILAGLSDYAGAFALTINWSR